MDADIAERVRAIIARVGVTNREFALEIDIPEDQLSKALNGKRRFSSYELAAIASLGGTTVDALTTGAAPTRLGLAARAIGIDDTSTYEAEALRVAQRFAKAGDVLVDFKRRTTLKRLPLPNRSNLFVDEGQKSAALALKALGDEAEVAKLLLGPTMDLVVRLEETFHVDVASTADLPIGFDGLSFQTSTLRLVLLLTTENWTRRRFTLAHELGHIFWEDALDKPLTEKLAPGNVHGYDEKRANAFAAAFLMPEWLIKDLLGGRDLNDDRTFHELVWKLKVSPSALAVRLLKLQLINQARMNELRSYRTVDALAASSAGRDELQLQELTLAQSPWPPPHMLLEFLDLYRSGDVSAAPLVELTGQPESSWRELFTQPESEPQIAHDTLDTDDLAFVP